MTRMTSLTVPADFYDALKSQCAAHKREVRRLRGWLRWIAWRATKLPDGASEGFRTMAHSVENQAKDALRGWSAPRRRIAR